MAAEETTLCVAITGHKELDDTKEQQLDEELQTQQARWGGSLGFQFGIDPRSHRLCSKQPLGKYLIDR